MASFAVAPSCTASKPSLKSAPRHSLPVARLPARRAQRPIVVAAQKQNKASDDNGHQLIILS